MENIQIHPTKPRTFFILYLNIDLYYFADPDIKKDIAALIDKNVEMNEARREESIKSGSNIPFHPKQAFPSNHSHNNTTEATQHTRDVTRDGSEH